MIWFMFDNPGGPGRAYVPARSEEQARRQMQDAAYPGAKWPFEVACRGSRVIEREALVAELLRRAAPGNSAEGKDER